MRISMRTKVTPRPKRLRVATGIVIGGLLGGLLTMPAVAADVPPATGPVSDRMKAVAAWKAGGPAMRRAVEAALTGSDSDLKAFLATGQAAAADQDLRAQIESLIGSSGPGVRAAATAALAGSAADLQAFLDKGLQKNYEDDQRVRLSQLMVTGGPGVKAGAQKAMDGSLEEVTAFLNVGQYKARDDDDRVHLSQLMASGGPEVKKAAGAALNSGGMDEVQLFLKYGYQTAAAHDQETLTVAQLADLTKNASAQAGEQAKDAKEAAARAVDASRRAKEASERAAAETQAAQGEAGRASSAAERAADAVSRAADAAQTASAAAKAANEAARQAANAAANAASASIRAGKAAARALSAANAAGNDATQAEAANQAAGAARQAAVDARSSADASGWARKASDEAKDAALSAASAGGNAAAAATATANAAGASGVASSSAERARQAAARARAAAAEATRAANATVKIAAEASAAAKAAQQAANAAAGHAEAAAAAAEEAARHAGSSAGSADAAQAAANAAAAAADAAGNTATQAHKVADVARASDQERLDAQQAAEMAAAEDATREDIVKTRTAAWEAGKAARYAAGTEQLLTEATATGVEPKTAVLKGRQAALRLLDTGGPWAVAASEAALEGADDAVLTFLSTGLAEARDRDNRTSVMAIAMGPTKLAQREAAEAAAVGSPDQVAAFLATGQYQGKDDDDRVQLSQIMAAGGPGVKAAAGKALDGTIADVREFLTTGQYRAREDDNRVLVTQALTNATPEVKAAAQAVLSGPAARLEPFLQSGQYSARQRDAFTAMHVATVNAYLADIDGSAALARQYAAEAGQSYATARGAAAEAAGYAAQAQTSATQAAGWSAKAAASANQAQGSATQAADYAKQALTNAASANAAAASANASAAAAAGYAKRARQYAATAKAAYNQALAEAAAAGRSRDEADRAAADAKYAVWVKQQAETLISQLLKDTNSTDSESNQQSALEQQIRDGVTPEIIKQDMTKCIEDDAGGFPDILYKWNRKTWHKNAAGVNVCNVKVTVKTKGTVDLVMRTCPEPGLNLEACKLKYGDLETVVLDSKQVEHVEDTEIEMSYVEYQNHYKLYCSTDGPANCISMDGSKLVLKALTDDFVKCFDNPGFNAPCGWAGSNFIPYKTLITAAKSITAYRFAILAGVGIEDAKLALQVSLDGYSQAVKAKLDNIADAVTKFRLTLTEGRGTEEALAALRNNPNIDHTLLEQMEIEADLAQGARTACPINSFPAATQVLLADGSYRAISEVRTGDQVLAADPATAQTGPQLVTATFAHDTERLVDVDLADGSTLSTTAGHRFYVDTKGWVVASELQTGDDLRTADGSPQAVITLRDRSGLPAQPVYDLTVGGLHTFHVRASGDRGKGLLVHNCRNIVADEGLSGAHTLDQHVDISGTKLVKKVDKDGVASVWNDRDTAVRAVQKAYDQWYNTKDNAKKLGRWIQKQQSRPKTDTSFIAERDAFSFTWTVRDEGSLGTAYTKNADPNAQNPLTGIATGNTVVVTLRFDRYHPEKFVVFTAYPK
ncbi:polymorphic toxin-type HINT domain-containing protein [Kitasatospora sp. NPDC093806]|uniref:polymorphic toxin-type HINT domain-containing protein n=1 Tax=Kitasatospora sp. NPDC093806 TaxID=3155075 RepID=UPI00343D1AC1